MGLETLIFDLLTLKPVCESHLRWGTFIPNLDTLGLWALELFAMYATDGRTNKCNANCPLPYERGHNNAQNVQFGAGPLLCHALHLSMTSTRWLTAT